MFPAITKTTPANYVPEILQPHHFINTSTNPDNGHTPNYIHQNEVKVTSESLKVQQLFVESSS